MKKILLIIAVVLLAYTEINAQAGVLGMFRANYFVSENGSSSNSGKYPWAPIPASKLDSITLLPGQIVAFNRGDSFGTITVKQSGTSGKPITYTWYGTTGAKPIVNTIILDTLVYSNVVIKNIDGEKFYSKTYFVNNSGNNSANGLTPETAWQTIAKVNASTFEPGDFIAFEKDGVWRESLTVPSSGTSGNPIVFGAYGTGARPVITGFDVVTNWTHVAGTASQVATELLVNLNTNYPNSTRYNIRQVIPVDSINLAGDSIRIAVKGHSTNSAVLSGASIGVKGVEANFAATPTRITWDGGSNGTTVGAGELKYSDWVYFPTDTTKTYLVHLYGNDSPDWAYATSSLTAYYNTTNVDNTMTTDVTYDSSPAMRWLSRLEVKTEAGNQNIYRTPHTPAVAVVMVEDSLCSLTASKDLTDNYTYYLDTANDSLYVSFDTTLTAEVSKRNEVILCRKNNITIKDLSLTGSYYSGMYFYGEINGTVILRNNIVDNVDMYHNYIGLQLNYGNRNATIKNCEVYDNTNSGINGYINNDTVLIHNNISHDNGRPWQTGESDGIGLFETSNLTITNNTCYNNRGSGISLDNNNTYSVVTVMYNKIYDNANDPLYERQGLAFGRMQGTQNLFAYNLIYNNGYDGNPGVKSQFLITDSRMNFYNNTIYVDDTPAYGGGFLIESNNTNINIKNNAIVFNGQLTQSAERILSGSPTINSNYNLVYGTIANLFRNGATHYTFAQWQGLGYDANSVNADPLFTNGANRNFTLQTGSPAINAGVEIPGLPDTDIAGNPIVGARDIGAYEKQ